MAKPQSESADVPTQPTGEHPSGLAEGGGADPAGADAGAPPPETGQRSVPAGGERSGSGGWLLMALALAGVVAADVPGASGWAWPGSFALLGALAAAVTLALAFLADRVRGVGRG